MNDDVVELGTSARGARLGRLRGELMLCIARAEKLGLVAIAIYLQRAVDEIGDAEC